MIVDMHYHLIPMLPEEMVEHLVEDPMRTAKIMGKKIDKAALVKKASEIYADPTGERLIASMEDSGIDFTCICAVDNAENELLTLELAQMQNQVIGGIAQRFPDKVMALAGIDPRRPNAPDMMKRCFEEFGMRGLKYHPDSGYDPSGVQSYKLLEIVQKNGGVLLTHTGPLAPPSRCKYTDPMLLSDLAVDFPDLKVVAAHMGQMNWRPWAALASHQPNLYGDLAMWDAFAFGHYELFCRELRDLLDYAGDSKVLFGTDNPIFSIVIPTRDWIQLIRDLPTNSPAGIKFTRQEVDGILGGNAAAMLGLKK
ncbi:amidohydrolase family protein [Candidatus Poribacteria bacterium]|nr:amidohydrolase family protein [Candidatus Poribacteria bacterium]